MLGETYELVTEEFRFVAEKVSHTPKQVFCYFLEGKSYRAWGYQSPKPQLRLNGGKGMMEMNQLGINDVYLKKFDENICISKPTIRFKNLFFGGLYIDLAGEMMGLNVKTKESIAV